MEKVRFCMDYAGIAYEEEQDCGSIGLIFHGRTVPTLMCKARAVSISNSSDIFRYLFATNSDKEKARAFFMQTPESRLLEKKLDSYGQALKK